MAKRTIKFTYKDVDYTLGFTLASIEQMERAGFVIGELGDKTATRVRELFYGAFIAYHKGIKRKLVDEIYDNLADKENLILGLAELYNEAGESLIESGNVSWTMSE